MKNFKGIIMSEYTSKLTILASFSQNFLHDTKASIASAGFDTSIIFM